MPENGFELRRISWGETFPFVRLFRTHGLAVDPNRILIALLAIVCVYFSGRILDGIWKGGGGAVPVDPGSRVLAIDAYAAGDAAGYHTWLAQTSRARERLIAAAAVSLGKVEPRSDIQAVLAEKSLDDLLASDAHDQAVDKLVEDVDAWLSAALAAVSDNEDLSTAEADERRRQLREAADYLRFTLTGHDAKRLDLTGDPRVALEQLLRGGTELPAEQRAEVEKTLRSQVAINAVRQSAPRGPFIALVDYEMRCFAGAIRGVLGFRWGFGDGPAGERPSFLGSVASAASGVNWLVTQRPWYALFYAVVHFAIFAFFGGAICRHVAVRVTRDEPISPGEALKFACAKFGGLALAPAVPAVIFLIAAVVLWLGSLVAAIPFLGTLLAGFTYGLALLGGFALAMILIGTVLGLHLMWPTIAVEGSDAFDGVTHAIGYVGQRAWHAAFYSIALLLYGAVTFSLVRLIAMVALKLTHAVTNSGMSFFGAISSSETATLTKLDAMWHMPAWGDLALLPSTSGAPFWGTFWNAPVGGAEGFAMVLIMCWIFLIVALVAAYVVSFFFCGSTQMYLLLRHDVDAVDYDEIFYEEPEDALPPAEEGEGTPAEDEHGAPAAEASDSPAEEPASSSEEAAQSAKEEDEEQDKSDRPSSDEDKPSGDRPSA